MKRKISDTNITTDSEEVKKPKIRTKISVCKYGIKCPNKETCEFLHPYGERRFHPGGTGKVPCMFGAKCQKGKDCPFLHEKLLPLTKDQKKELTKQYKVNRNNGDIVLKSNQLYNELRVLDITSDDRLLLMEQLMVLLKDKLVDIIFKHDASRVVQCMFKYGNADQRTAIYNEIKSRFLDCCKTKHGVFLAVCLIRYSDDKILDDIMNELRGHLMQLSTHTLGSKVIEYLYDQKLSDQQCDKFIQELYSKEFTHFPSTYSNLKDIITSSPEKAVKIKQRLLKFLEKIIEKNLTDVGYVHRLLYEYLSIATPNEIYSLSETYKDTLPALLVTKDGAIAATMFIGYSNAKNRKAIIKTFSGQVEKLVNHPFAFLSVMKLFETVDDTIYLNKNITQDMTKKMTDILLSRNGSVVLLQLYHPFSNTYLSPSQIELLQPNTILNDKNEKIPTSKKDSEIRRAEILKAIHPHLIQSYLDNLEELLQSQQSGYLLSELIKIGQDKDRLLSSIISLLENKKDVTTNLNSYISLRRIGKSIKETDPDASIKILSILKQSK